MEINSATFAQIVRDHDLFPENRSPNAVLPINISDRDVIRALIMKYPSNTLFKIVNFERFYRYRLYIAINELSIPYTKDRINNNYAIVNLTINNITRYNITNNIHNFITSEYGVHFSYDANNHAVRLSNNRFSQSTFADTDTEFMIEDAYITSLNMQKKIQLSDIIFDIKDNLTDYVYKQIMDTLSQIR